MQDVKKHVMKVLVLYPPKHPLFRLSRPLLEPRAATPEINFNFGQFSPYKYGMLLTTRRPLGVALFQKAGGNLDNYIPDPNSGGFTGPQVLKQVQDAVNVVGPYLTTHWDETVDSEKQLGYGFGSVAAGTFIPYLDDKSGIASVKTGLPYGWPIDAALAALRDVGYAASETARTILMVLTDDRIGECTVSNQGAEISKDQPVFFGGEDSYVTAAQAPYLWINGLTGEVQRYVDSNLAGDYDALRIGGEFTMLPIPKDIGIRITKRLIETPGHEWTGLDDPSDPEAGVAIPGSYMNYGLWARYTDLREIVTFFAAESADFLSRFDAVNFLADEINLKVLNAAKATGIPYGVTDYVSRMPLTPTAKIALTRSSEFMSVPALITFGAVSYLIPLNRINPFGKVGDPNIQGVEIPGEAPGEPSRMSEIGWNILFDIYVYQTFPAYMAAQAMLGMYKRIDFRSVEPGAGSQNKKPVASKFGALFLWWRQGDEKALPNCLELDSWANMSARLSEGSVTKQQIANAAWGLFSDPVLKSLLVDHPVPEIVQKFTDSSPNAALLLDCYHGIKPKTAVWQHRYYGKRFMLMKQR